MADAAWAIMADLRRDMAQWWTPWRRQQGGKRASSAAPSAAAKGPRAKKKTRKMERARRIWDSCYMSSWNPTLAIEKIARMGHPGPWLRVGFG